MVLWYCIVALLLRKLQDLPPLFEKEAIRSSAFRKKHATFSPFTNGSTNRSTKASTEVSTKGSTKESMEFSLIKWHENLLVLKLFHGSYAEVGIAFFFSGGKWSRVQSTCRENAKETRKRGFFVARSEGAKPSWNILGYFFIENFDIQKYHVNRTDMKILFVSAFFVRPLVCSVMFLRIRWSASAFRLPCLNATRKWFFAESIFSHGLIFFFSWVWE